MKNFIKRTIDRIRRKPLLVKPVVSTSSFLTFRWDGDLSKLDSKKIYAYYEPDYGGIYKSMELSLIGNVDFSDRAFKENMKYFGFIRIDNNVGYCQFMYKTMKELFEHHIKSLHNRYEIYVFESTKQFYEWCLTFEKLR